jgi:two-component system NtrC family sensor kinase
MRTRIGTRLILGTGIVTFAIIGGMAVTILRAHRADLLNERTRSANQLAETVKSSTHYDMLENRRDNLRRSIEAIGGKEGIEKIRLYNKEGRIMFSSDPDEPGRVVDIRAEACSACHAGDRPLEQLPLKARSRIFEGAAGHRVLGILNPIENQPSCTAAACHAHSPQDSILGVLDVTVSLAEVDREIAGSRARLAALAGLAIAASALILWILNRRLVLRPVAALAAGTRRVSEGDLSTTIPVEATHELGELARAFNEMTRKLAEAQRQIAQSDKLASVGRLAAGVAHEINNPLTGILTYASFLLKRAEGNPELKSDLEVIVRETKRCRDIVKGLLDFARQTPPRRQDTDINEVARKAVAVVMNQLSLNRVALSLDLASDLPSLFADPNQLQQVLVNLIVNSADAIGETGGSIRVASRRVLLPAWGHAPIRRAACPKGCDLLDASVRMGGHPAPRVAQVCKGREAIVHLDPIYGRCIHSASEPCEEGILAAFHCPRCRASLLVPGRKCGTCGSPVFGVEVPEQGRVEWCTANGCHWTTWEAMEERGPRPMLELEVEDSGSGIPAGDLPHLFEPFFTTKGTRGTGLGLAVSWGIVEAHDGTIEVASEAGKGSSFLVRLPLEAAAERKEPRRPPAPTTPAASTPAAPEEVRRVG